MALDLETQPSGPRVNRLMETAIYVEDLDVAAAFYDRIFRFPALHRDARLAAYDAGHPTVFLLFKRGASLTEQVLPGGVIPPHDGSGPAHFCFAVDAEELAAWEGHLDSSGIDIENRVRWAQGGESIYFRDPDQHLVELWARPAFGGPTGMGVIGHKETKLSKLERCASIGERP